MFKLLISLIFPIAFVIFSNHCSLAAETLLDELVKTTFAKDFKQELQNVEMIRVNLFLKEDTKRIVINQPTHSTKIIALLKQHDYIQSTGYQVKEILLKSHNKQTSIDINDPFAINKIINDLGRGVEYSIQHRCSIDSPIQDFELIFYNNENTPKRLSLLDDHNLTFNGMRYVLYNPREFFNTIFTYLLSNHYISKEIYDFYMNRFEFDTETVKYLSEALKSIKKNWKFPKSLKPYLTNDYVAYAIFEMDQNGIPSNFRVYTYDKYAKTIQESIITALHKTKFSIPPLTAFKGCDSLLFYIYFKVE